MKNSHWTSLRFRLTAILVVVSFFIGTFMVFYLSRIYQNRIDSEFKRLAVSTAVIASSILDGETLQRYLLTLEKDEEYERILKHLRLIQRKTGVTYIYISNIKGDIETFIFDTDEETAMNLGDVLDLGEIKDKNAKYIEALAQFNRGERIIPYKLASEWGPLLISGEPIFLNDGTLIAYANVGVSLDRLHQEHRILLFITSIIVIFSFALIITISVNAINKFMLNPIHDITESEQKANRAKSTFLSTMSHEMRTPMNAIIGMTAIGKKTDDIEKKNIALNKIEEAASHLLGIINDTLDMSKIEANKLKLIPTKFNFESMLQKVLNIIYFRANEKKQEVSVVIDEKIPQCMTGDDQRLAQVITNLMSNAVKFSPEGGKIGLEASLVEEIDGICELRIEVSDNGIGISSQQQDKLFHEFEQAENGTSRNYGGTGLGLVISKNIIELMGGKIWIESELGKGSKFIFTTKMQRCKKVERRKHSEKDNTGSGVFAGKRMLLAEDIEVNREIIISLLEDTGIKIDSAEDGLEALEMIKASPKKYDAVLMDVQMPRMDGLEATRKIRALPELQDAKLPIIAMTANVFKSDIEECIAAGMDCHLGKPVDIDKMVETLKRFL